MRTKAIGRVSDDGSARYLIPLVRQQLAADHPHHRTGREPQCGGEKRAECSTNTNAGTARSGWSAFY